MNNHIVTLPGLLCVAAAVTGGCADDEQGVEDCPYVHSPEECKEQEEDGGNDEVGDGDEAAKDEPRCVTKSDGIQRTVLQCNGRLTATIQFKTLLGDCAKLLGSSKFCQESHEFGVGFDHYEMPAVMACCDAEGVPEDDILVDDGRDPPKFDCESNHLAGAGLRQKLGTRRSTAIDRAEPSAKAEGQVGSLAFKGTVRPS